jgi:hypothetical protein
MWHATTSKVDLQDWPRQKPDHLSKEAYEKLKRLFKDYIMHVGDTPATKPTRPEFLVCNMIRQNFGTSHHMKRRDDDDEIPVDTEEPIVYPKSKNVKPFRGLFGIQNVKTQQVDSTKPAEATQRYVAPRPSKSSVQDRLKLKLKQNQATKRPDLTNVFSERNGNLR